MILAILLVGVRAFGLQIYTVLSGSMEPTYKTGALVYVQKVDPAELRENDVITFRLNSDTTATHRIIELVEDEENSEIVRFRTKGDSNKVADNGLVEFGSVVGKPIFTIPYLGYLAVYMQSPPGSYVTICVAVSIVLFVVVTDIIVGDDKKKKMKKKRLKLNN